MNPIPPVQQNRNIARPTSISPLVVRTTFLQFGQYEFVAEIDILFTIERIVILLYKLKWDSFLALLTIVFYVFCEFILKLDHF
jgi:hypothetical protein